MRLSLGEPHTWTSLATRSRKSGSAPVEMTKGRVALPETVVAEEKRFFMRPWVGTRPIETPVGGTLNTHIFSGSLNLLVFSRLEVHAKEIVQGPAATGLVPPHNCFASLLQTGRFAANEAAVVVNT